jgi:hypothetical protein
MAYKADIMDSGDATTDDDFRSRSLPVRRISGRKTSTKVEKKSEQELVTTRMLMMITTTTRKRKRRRRVVTIISTMPRKVHSEKRKKKLDRHPRRF